MPQKGFKYRIYPNAQQREYLNKCFGHARFVWNTLLHQIEDNNKQREDNPNLPRLGVSGYDFVKRLPVLKADPETAFLKEVSSVALQQKALDLGGAFQRFFDKKLNARFPRYKKRRARQSVRLTGAAFSCKDGALVIAKCATPLKVKWSRTLPSEPSSVTLSRDTLGHYYASFVCEYDPQLTNGDEAIGLDMGLKDFYTDSNGEKVAPPKYLRHNEAKLKRAQKALSRKVKGSANRNKARLRVAKLHRKIANQRLDFLHKLSRTLVNRCKLVVIEDLNVRGMLRNHRLAKSVSDLGWGRFVDLLIYKASESMQCLVAKIDRWFPSTQTCSVCNHRRSGEAKIKLSQRLWTCGHCGTDHDRDVNAATNILSEAMRQFDRAPTLLEHSGLVLLKQECA